MLISSWRPYAGLRSEIGRFQNEMNRLFDSFGLGDDGWPRLAAYPPVNIWQDADNVYCEAELPGLELKDLEIYVNGGNQLTIKGERKQPAHEKGVWHRQERSFCSFARAISLPVDVDVNKVQGAFANGVLTITMPKSETAKPRRITVKTE